MQPIFMDECVDGDMGYGYGVYRQCGSVGRYRNILASVVFIMGSISKIGSSNIPFVSSYLSADGNALLAVSLYCYIPAYIT